MWVCVRVLKGKATKMATYILTHTSRHTLPHMINNPKELTNRLEQGSLFYSYKSRNDFYDQFDYSYNYLNLIHSVWTEAATTEHCNRRNTKLNVNI